MSLSLIFEPSENLSLQRYKEKIGCVLITLLSGFRLATTN